MKNRRILILCPYPERVAPSQRLKYEQYFSHLRKCHYDLTISPFMSKSLWKIVYQEGYLFKKVAWVLWGYLRRIYDVLRLSFYDGAYVCLWVTPFGTSFFERLIRLTAKRLIYDIDDLVFLGRTSKANSFIARFKKPSKYVYLMKCADHVITCTPYLDNYVRQFNQKTTDISSTINTHTYIPKKHHSNQKELIIGWSGSHTTAPYLHILDNVFRELCKTYKYKLLVIGDATFNMPGVNVEAIGWDELSEVEQLSRIDIGVYPLPNEDWVYGKSGLKALQYMALGIPTVATAIGANFRVIENGVSGFLVTSEEEWKNKIERLIGNPDLRHRIGSCARERVERQYSVLANRSVYLKVFDGTFGSHGAYSDHGNIDWKTVEGFGYEWGRFDQIPLTESELNEVHSRYFQIFPWTSISKDAEGFDLGCGSGRWSSFVAGRVSRLHCIDPSEEAVDVAKRNLAGYSNCSFHVAGVDDMPLKNESMDFGYSLGVLHHVPDTLAGLKACTAKLKAGAPFLLYIYYNFENRPRWYPMLWGLTDRVRRGVSRLPNGLKYVVSQVLAFMIYFPLARTAFLLEKCGFEVTNFPLASYRNLSFYLMRADSLDRFGTRLESRFTSSEVKRMMEEAGLDRIVFSEEEPFWCAVGYKKSKNFQGVLNGFGKVPRQRFSETHPI